MDLAGVFAAITTPFVDDELSLENLERNIQMWLISPLNGFVALGTTGEFASLTFEERLQVITRSVEAAEGRPVIAGTGCPSTLETVALTLAAAERGAQAALVVPPYYHWEAMNDAALYEHYTAVADAAPVPVILYNFPAAARVTLTPDLVAELAVHPNIIGMKDSSSDLARFGEHLARTPDDFALMTGSSSLLLPAMVMGAAGGILALANVAPWECCELYELVRDGKMEEAAALQRRLTRVTEKVGGEYGIPGIKALMAMLGYFGGAPRTPMLAIDDADLDDIRMTLKEVRMLGC
ncbi:MAG: dihydrodipicolinate synthase family protein [Thermaerobacterales bacterium]